MKSSNNKAAGFTLVEVAVAVAILGVGLVTLIGLHTRMLDTYFNERNRFQASLFAQYLMTQVEVLREAPEPGVETDGLISALEEAGYFDEDSFEKPDEQLQTWQFRREVSPIGLPLATEELAEDALRRIDITIEWGPSEDEQYTLVHFMTPLDIGSRPAARPTSGNNRTGGTPTG